MTKMWNNRMIQYDGTGKKWSTIIYSNMKAPWKPYTKFKKTLQKSTYFMIPLTWNDQDRQCTGPKSRLVFA